ncbi:MAG TPA: TonB-dependent receptor plug domain-containing protein, partial [Chthoniobacterales bacterium]
MKRTIGATLLVSLALIFFAPAHAQEAVGENIVVTAAREPNAGGPFATHDISHEELERAPELRLDDILRAEVPGFSLFRRSSSAVANPTTQGVTLRNFGPSGAGRTLVLVDGIPLNDPFAGYVLWNQLPPAAVGNIVIAPGGGAGLFGNAALAGTIFIDSRKAERTSAEVDVIAGSYDTYSTSAFGSIVEKHVTLSGFAERFSTSGYPVLQAS